MIFTPTRASFAGMAALAIASFLYMGHLGLETGVLENRRTANMTVSDTNGLVVGSRVLLRGVPIGQVTDISSAADHVSIVIDYDRGYQIPIDSRFRVDNLSALGEAYVGVLPAAESGPYLGDRAMIDPAHVIVPTTFNELSARLTRMLEQIEPDKIQRIFEELNIALPDDTRVLVNLNHAGELLATMFTNQSGDLTKLFNTMQPLLLQSATVPGDLVGTTPNLTHLGSSLTDLVNNVEFSRSETPLTAGARDGVIPFLGGLQGFLDNNSSDLQNLGVDLLPGVRAGATALSTVNVSQLLDNALASTDSDGSVTVHVKMPGK
ncbi:MCE family protein (plasmid) [Rhodococcus sp. ZPP]|uniref:MlaD family protein n=1 Tax=Rhodococcus sp. ZPP TaxID=2749906 RepID=UPI001AD86017|nr:MlaD family protein [Rhodococcus sp. ZPP]QTJ70733.1 MCE family protein [Rhodococcus sp. ZPP]